VLWEMVISWKGRRSLSREKREEREQRRSDRFF
jgi:hypothetical protein